MITNDQFRTHKSNGFFITNYKSILYFFGMVFHQKIIFNLFHTHHATYFFYFHHQKIKKQSTLHLHQYYQSWNKYGRWVAGFNDAFRAKKL